MKKIKVENKEFSVSDLPKTRMELFFDILKNQWRNLLLLAVIITVLFLPFVLLRYINLMMVNSLINSGNATDINDQIFNYNVAYYLINFVVVIIIGILFGGVARIYKKLTYNDGFFLGADFVKGIKENAKDFSLLFVIFGTLNLLIEVLCVNYMLENNYLYYFFQVINYFTLLPILLISISLSAIYSDGVLTKIMVACKLYVKYLLKILLVLVILLSPLALLLLGSSGIQLFVPIVYSAIYFPVAYVVVVLIFNSIFDEVINKKNFPHLYRKGMYTNVKKC